MTEAEFWTALEFRVSREIQGLSDNRLRFLFCDGFVPDDVQPTANAIVGRAFVSEDDGRSFPDYRFRVSLSGRVSGPSGVSWDALLPPDSSHDWLTIDRERKFIEMRLGHPTELGL